MRMTDQFERLRQGALDPDISIWRYLTFPKFVSLVTTQALWFSKLEVLDDTLEGTVPQPARSKMQEQAREMENWFPDEQRKQQIRGSVEQNVEDGRELIVANCWFIGEHESQGMWRDYASGSEGVAIRSDARSLANSVAVSHKHWWMGHVAYVDVANHEEMTIYDAHQARVRAFVKSKAYSGENELRIATMNWVAPGCLNPDGSPQNAKQKSGLVYSPDRAGILVRANLQMLIKEIRSSADVSEWHHNLICLIATNASLGCPISRSELGVKA